MNRIDEPEGQGDERTWTPESGEDLERASENVLDGWPASPPATTGDEESVELPASYEAEVDAEPDVDDPDAHHAKAVAEGANVIRPLQDEPYGARGYMAEDPEGHQWFFLQHVRDANEK